MAHVRTQIRDAVVAALKAVPGLTGIVSMGRIFTQQTAPAVIVYTVDEIGELATVGRPMLTSRELTVSIDVMSKAGEGQVDAEIDDLCVLIEGALDESLVVPALSWAYAGLQMTTSKDGEKAAAVARLEWVFNYNIYEGDAAQGV
jgi:hypothetical protein